MYIAEIFGKNKTFMLENEKREKEMHAIVSQMEKLELQCVIECLAKIKECIKFVGGRQK